MDIDTIHQASQNRFPCPHMKNTLFLVELAAYIYVGVRTIRMRKKVLGKSSGFQTTSSPHFSQGQQSERNASAVKITPREKGDSREELFSRAPRFARSVTIPEEKWGLVSGFRFKCYIFVDCTCS